MPRQTNPVPGRGERDRASSGPAMRGRRSSHPGPPHARVPLARERTTPSPPPRPSREAAHDHGHQRMLSRRCQASPRPRTPRPRWGTDPGSSPRQHPERRPPAQRLGGKWLKALATEFADISPNARRNARPKERPRPLSIWTCCILMRNRGKHTDNEIQREIMDRYGFDAIDVLDRLLRAVGQLRESQPDAPADPLREEWADQWSALNTEEWTPVPEDSTDAPPPVGPIANAKIDRPRGRSPPSGGDGVEGPARYAARRYQRPPRSALRQGSAPPRTPESEGNAGHTFTNNRYPSSPPTTVAPTQGARAWWMDSAETEVASPTFDDHLRVTSAGARLCSPHV